MTAKDVLDKYPWFEGIVHDDGEGGIFFSEAPQGWNYIILMIAEELNPIVPKDYQVLQVKEKYGELRWYDAYSCDEQFDKNATDKIQNIIDKYSAATSHICALCGKPDVPYTKDDYIYPVCENCYTNKLKWAKPYKEAVTELPMLPDEWGYIRYTDEGKKEFTFSNADLNNKIRDTWSKIYK